jgi:hypothetical protein
VSTSKVRVRAVYGNNREIAWMVTCPVSHYWYQGAYFIKWSDAVTYALSGKWPSHGSLSFR